MAHALHKMITDICEAAADDDDDDEDGSDLDRRLSSLPPVGSTRTTATTATKAKRRKSASALCPDVWPTPSGQDLLKYIRNVSFTSKK